MSAKEDFKEVVAGSGAGLEALKLKNGSEEAKPLVIVVMVSLNTLLDKGFPGMLTAYDLVQICQGRDYKPSGNNLQMLKDLQLLQPDGQPHSSVRNIILSAVEGEGLGMSFGSPLAQETPMALASTSASPKTPGA